jgi:hypothetical protein
VIRDNLPVALRDLDDGIAYIAADPTIVALFARIEDPEHLAALEERERDADGNPTWSLRAQIRACRRAQAVARSTRRRVLLSHAPARSRARSRRPRRRSATRSSARSGDSGSEGAPGRAGLHLHLADSVAAPSAPLTFASGTSSG